MSAGSGPYCSAPVTSGSITTTANAFTATSPVCNWNETLGVLITVTLFWTPSATQTITAKLYQVSTAGTQVGPAGGLIATGTGTTEQAATFTFQDTSAFAQGPTAGAVYVCGFTASTGTGTVNYVFVEIETMAQVLLWPA
jgi:hypothetical protein